MSVIDASAFVAPDTVAVTGAVGEHLGTGWTLIGGMMVAVHLAVHGRQPLRLTKDADIVVDVRSVVDPPLLRRATSALIELGF